MILTKHRVMLATGYVEFADAAAAATWRDEKAPGASIETFDDEVSPKVKPPHRVLKDTVIQRVKAAGMLSYLRGMIDGLSPDDHFEWDGSSWFHSDNPMLVQGVAALGLDPAMILAPDPLAP